MAYQPSTAEKLQRRVSRHVRLRGQATSGVHYEQREDGQRKPDLLRVVITPLVLGTAFVFPINLPRLKYSISDQNITGRGKCELGKEIEKRDRDRDRE